METLNCRILNRRVHGRSAFLDVLSNGNRIQTYLTADLINFSELTQLPNGSFVRLEGEYFITRTGHNTLRIAVGTVLLVPNRHLPVVQTDGEQRFNDITDVEHIRRRRYLHTILNESERNAFIVRSRVINLIRNFFISRQYLEVDTPVLQPVYGGAEATPFTTRFDSLDCDFYLRIAPELYLRRMIIGGYDRVFEIGRNFRNEGISNRHNPEFTFIEVYTAFENYMFSMDVVTDLFVEIATEFGEVEFQGNTINFGNISRRRYSELVAEYCNVDVTTITTEELVRLFEENVERNLINPTIVYDYPASISPLAQVSAENLLIAERFEVYVGGMEIGNAYSELNDVQTHLRNIGDDDADFVEALEYGMPPTTGIGLGIDRIVMILTNRHIRDVIFFPAMRRT
jgi:lysyl-tRNA synthetase class 2